MSNNSFENIQITFEQIKSIWKKYLWPERPIEEIKTHSSMKFMEGYDMEIYNNNVCYFALAKEGNIVAVNSGFKTDHDYYRSRGLFVFPEYRNQGLAQRILETTIKQAQTEKSSMIWSFPRISSLSAYQSVGFKVCSEIIYEDVVSGPNCYVKLEV